MSGSKKKYCNIYIFIIVIIITKTVESISKLINLI